MGHTFSKDQLSIIEARNSNILVSAAAGSGKTSVLTERITRLVTDKDNPVDIDRILVVTFTSAAATEMRERIEASLNDALAADPLNAHLQKQLTLIHGAYITTIDSFCLNLVRSHFHRINLDPSFRIAGQGEIELLKQDTLKSVIKASYESGRESFYHIVDCFSKKDRDDSLESSISDLYHFAMSYPWPRQWIESHRNDYFYENVGEFETSKLCEDVRLSILHRLKQIHADADKTLDYCMKCNGLGPDAYVPTIQADLEAIEGLTDSVKDASYVKIAEIIKGFKWSTLKSCKNPASQEAVDFAKKLRDKYKKSLSGIVEDYFFESIDDIVKDLNESGKIVNELCDLTIAYIDALDAAKRERNIIDFSDMEHMAVEILVSDYKSFEDYSITEVAKAYRDYFAEVMVDEYQDSNLVQELLIQSVSRERCDGNRNRFMVGDIKQSIYRFRLARPEIFKAKLNSYQKGDTEPSRLIVLKENFRSRQCVVDSVNAVFEKIMSGECGGTDYDADARLYKGASYPDDLPDNKSEVLLVETGKSMKSDKRRALECDLIALKIREEIRNGKLKVKDRKTGEMRPATYGDAAVLFRSPSKYLSMLKASFEKLDIPFHIEDSGSFYDTREIGDIMAFLKVVNNPLDDVSLYAAMTSYFGGFNDSECAFIKGNSGAGNYYLWDCLVSYRDMFPGDSKLEAFMDRVSKYRELSGTVAIHELIEKLLRETNYREIVSALPGGEQRAANVNLLVAKACDYAKTSFYGLFHFLRYVELIKKINQVEGEADVLQEGANVVRVMSIHKSKGLEFPLCIVAGMDDPFNDEDSKKAFVCDIDAGIGTDYIAPDKRIKRRTLFKQYIIDKARHENLGEEIRVLYVALTRAREKLVLIGTDESPEALFERGISASRNSYLGLISEVVANSNTFARFKYLRDDVIKGIAREDISMAVKRAEFEALSYESHDSVMDALRQRFAYEYPHKELAMLYTKTTVSELKLKAMETEDDEALHPFRETSNREYIPQFAEGATDVKGVDRGTAYHNLLSKLDFSKFNVGHRYSAAENRSELMRQSSELVNSSKISSEIREQVFTGKVVTFLNSDLAYEMSEAARNGCLFKEQPFVIGVCASKIDPAIPSDHTVLVQGVIDAYYETADGIVIMDYKTDKVNDAAELISRYHTQLEYYSGAITRLLGKSVKNLFIYSFGLETTIVLN